jgi:tetratricopeptide (TPR) repeat protein
MTDVWSQYAATLSRLGRYPEALDGYKQVIRLQPGEPNGMLGAAGVLLALGRFDEARAHADLAIKSSPSQAHQTIALIELQRGRLQEALAQAELAEKADPGLPLVLFVRGRIEYDSNRLSEALRYLEEARKAYAQRALQARDLHYLIGDALARLDRYREAEPYLREEIRLYPSHIRARASLAMLYQAMGRPDDAERTLDELLRTVPVPEAYQTAAQAWRMFGKPQRAAAVESAARKQFGR